MSNFSNLKSRLGTAGVLIAAVLLLIVAAAFSSIGQYLIVGIFLIVVVMAAIEGSSVCSLVPPDVLEQNRADGSPGYRSLLYLLGSALPAVVVALWYIVDGSGVLEARQVIERVSIVSIAVAFVTCSGVILFTRNSLYECERLNRDIWVLYLLVGIGGAFLVQIPVLGAAGVTHAGLMLLWLLVIVCVNDSVAYFAGSRIGGPKLAPELSPNKTIAGSLAGIIGGAAVGYVVGRACGLTLAGGTLVMVSILLVIAAQVADLLKSYLKRLHDVKDTGRILPGHGGILDRIDGILGASPLAVIFLCLY